MRLDRRHYHNAAEGTVTPTDALIDAAEATVSVGLREMCSRLNGDGKSFQRAADNLRRVGQVSMSWEKFRQVVEGEGKRVLAALASGALSPDWTASQCAAPPKPSPASTSVASCDTPGGDASGGQASPANLAAQPPQKQTMPKRSSPTPRNQPTPSNPPAPPPPAESLIYVSTDGFMVPLVTTAEKRKRRQQTLAKRRRQKRRGPRLGRVRPGADGRYKEFKAVMFYDHTMEHRLISVTRGDCRSAGRLMRRDGGRIGFAAATHRIGNIDGGPWAVNQVRRQLRPTAVGLDFYHLGENVHKARRAVYGEADEAGRTTAGQCLHLAKHEGYEPLRERLLEMRRGTRGSARRAAMDQLLHYISDRREMIRYPQFLAQGWQIGSGPMESQCRVVPDRVKGPGKRWDADHGEQIMALEALRQSHQWPAYWRLALDPPRPPE